MVLRNWSDCSPKEILCIEKSYFYFLKCYLKSRGLIFKDNTFKKKNNPDEEIDIECIGTSIRIRYIYINDKKQLKAIHLNRYVLYPEIIDCDVTYTLIPNPLWGYGFIEKMISTFDKFLLDDILCRKGTFAAILSENDIYLENIQTHPRGVITGKMIEEATSRMLQIKFVPTVLSLELYKQRINPYSSK
jgi:hypothetical protein